MFIYPGGKIPTWLKLSLVPAVLVLIGETWFHFIAPGDKGAILQSVFDSPLSQPVTAVLAIGVLILLFQYFLLLRLEAGFMKSSRTREPVNLSIVITVFYIVDVILIAIGFILANNAVMDTGILLIGLTGITYLLFMNRYPHFYQLVAREEKQQKYKKSVLQGLSKDKIVTRLKELMGEEKIYRQPELKLDEVASLLLINPHQLSELINDYMGMNFSSYINSYRVDEAKELLIKNPDQSTLSVGLEVGFGSKPSFNNIFKQATGMTPSEYRKIV
jgi:AraC-like DNA-binding protein